MNLKYIISISIVLLLGVSNSGIAQQNVQYTQFMYSKLWMNPGYAGSHDLSVVQAISRNQWIGLEGAPKSQSVNYHTALFGDRVGVGLSLNHDRIGPTNTYFANLSYAYRIRLNNDHKLSIGMQANLTSYSIRYNVLVATDEGDGVVPAGNQNMMRPNFGLGAYYSSNKFYIGISAPLILAGDLEFTGNSDISSSRQEFHSYLMAGMLHDIKGKVIQGKPSILLKKVVNAPFDLDLNYSVIFHNKIWVGASYRLGGDIGYGFGESLDFMLQYELDSGLRIGAAYDFTLSDLRSVNDGSIELMMQYRIKQDNSRLTNPRFF